MEDKKCFKCWDELKKNWKLKSWGQRYRCFSCKTSLTVGWARGTYTPNFKEKIMDMYCHKRISARKLAEKFNISTFSLVSWSKQHKKTCDRCKC